MMNRIETLDIFNLTKSKNIIGGINLNNKKLIGIVTIISNNLGNRLQNYALQEYLVSKGYKVKTIPMTTCNNILIKKLKLSVKYEIIFKKYLFEAILP